ncbi:MAG: S8 family serine peptidase [Flavobacteriales bacterium]
MFLVYRSILAVTFLFTLQTTFGQGPAYIPGDVLVMLAPGVVPERIIADLGTINDRPTGLTITREVSAPMRAWLLHFDEAAVAQPMMLRAIRGHSGVQMAQNNHVVKDRAVPNDPQYGQQWHHENIASEAAWDVSTGGVTATGDTIVVCIIEDCDLPHPDLIGNAWFNHAEIPDNGIDDDGNGYTDDHRGWNTPGNNDDVYGGGHGTQVAGMIGATGNNGLGVTGANWDVKMMVVDYGGTQEAAVVAAYTYPLVMRRLYNATGGTSGAFVVATNASWGIDGGDPDDSPLWCAMYDSLGAAGVLSCGATANNNVDVDAVGDLPTACASDFMISVTATDEADVRTFSGYGLTTIDVGAPGEDVRTTSLGGGYGSTSGTSFASPLTAGVIGLLYSAPCASFMSLVHGDPPAGALFVRQVLFDGVDQVGNLPGQTVTGGRINAGNSMTALMNSCGTCPAPYNLSAVNTGIADATLAWSSTAGTVFDLQYRPVGTATWTTVNGLNANSYSVMGLLACTQYEFQVSVDCGEEMSEFTVPFVWTSEGCCNAPPNLSATAIGEGGATIAWNPVLAAVSYDLQFAVQGTTDWIVISSISEMSTVLTDLLPCTGYAVQLRSVCNGVASAWSASFLFQTSGCGDCIDLTYCPSVGGTNDEWIASVAIGSIANTSGNNDGYGDFTDQSTALVIGQTYPITLTPGYAFFAYPEYFTVYMDLDRDGAFSSPDELVFDPENTANAVLTGDLSIPVGATPGPVRMRVVMQYDEPVLNGCVASFEYGETEDYCVNLLDPVGIQAPASTSVHVYPDPADRDIFFDLDGIALPGKALITITDASGRVVAQKAVAASRATVTTAWFADGLYAYRITAEGRELARGRFVVAHL